ncbi:ABC transporter ATP-binding protein [Lysinibacillus sphaericus]|uniref:ABC transporter ATP-binding protein/permease n=1 Tax=Lysinibacillus sphaericus TaxID=1421 RepID=A0A2S0JZY4_LYSSH|nr:ABC transporter ATP-binding protein [Lysinibacillus sphaericus]AVK96628.1 multidrug ABC transporter ATP-binding protein [Lysinibacillus sphaericus]MCS1383654.1 ABC transporter ATP-binding protein/permease [Lysinibacillus sphaericus]MED4542841.1 ABC transporter ATP-binding protein [Lysinibacillus sphaericus]TKI19870.1 ABC transporter ATP-binding protein [Lysinibacillus sphaericus]SUV17573.1 ABC transporter ATP-binding protein/permease [Lysinibacillus sphaericus]
MQVVKQLGRYLGPYKFFTLIAPILMVLEVTMDLIQPTIMQHMIDTGIANGDNPYVLQMFVLMLMSAVLGLVGGIGCSFYSSKAAIHFASDVRQSLYEKMMTYSAKERDAFTTGKLITILTSDVESVQRAFMMTLRIFVRGPLLFIGAVIIVFVTARELFSILLVIVPILIMAMYFFTKYSGVLYRKVQEAIDGVNTKLQENLAGIRVVKAFRREKHQVEQFAMLNDTLTKRFITAEQIVGILVPFTMFVVNIGIVAALWLGAIKVETGTLQVGVILAFINYLTIILNGLMSSSMVLMQIARALPSGERIVDVLNREVAVTEVAQPIKTSIQGMIDFQNVSYRYYENSEDVLKNITFSVQVGQTIGIIGKTGSGKSTLVKLLPRLVDPTSGVILLDGKPLHQYALPTLRKHIGFTSQKALLFSGTIEKNIRFGKEEATQQELQLALDAACATEFVAKLEQGPAHELSQGATNLSGGQKQRLALTRAFVRRPAILVLDDTTSALDSASEKQVQQAINEQFQETTTFIVASKITSIQQADLILVLEDGEIVGQGTHQHLLQNNKPYKAIYASQQKAGERQ